MKGLALGLVTLALALWAPYAQAQYQQCPANTVMAGPQTGPPAAPACRTLSSSDVPFPSNDIRSYKAKLDGVNDDGPAINSCLTANVVCNVPASRSGARIATPIATVGGSLIGMGFTGLSSPGATAYKFPGQAFLVCNTYPAPCVTIGNGSALGAGGLQDIVLTSAGTPQPGQIGLQILGGYNVVLKDVGVYNQDTCISAKSLGASGISLNGTDVYVALCKTHHWVFDGWPEARIVGGRAGANGTGDYASSDFVFQTLTGTVGAGGGPNGVTFADYQFNPGSNGPSCAFRWGGFTGSGGVVAETRLTNDHVEWNTGGTGIFCSDSTVPLINQLYVENLVTSTYTGSTWVPLFALDPKTALSEVHFGNNTIDSCNGITLAPTPASGPALSGVYFQGNSFCGPPRFTSNGVGMNVLLSTGNSWGSFTVSGAWAAFESYGDYLTSYTNTATGHVTISN